MSYHQLVHVTPAAVTANTSFGDMTIQHRGRLSITIAVSAAAVLSLYHNSVALKLNGGVALTADCLYTFTIAVDPSTPYKTLALRCDQNVTVRYCVCELDCDD